MNKCATCAGASIKMKTIPKYDADAIGAPFKVYLMDAVKVEVCSSCGKILNTAIPDPEGLLYAISFERAMHPRKLVGAEIRFLRHAMGWKAKKLADQLGITVEYLSRCENGHVAMSVTTEKLLRLLAVLRPGPPDEDKNPEAQEKVRDIVEDALRDLVRSMSSFQIDLLWVAKPLEFHFYRQAIPTRAGGLGPDDDKGKWKPEKLAA